MHRFRRPVAWFAGLLLLASPLRAAELSVVSQVPARHTSAPRGTAVSITFDRAVDPASVDAASVRVFGRWSGPASGDFGFSADGLTLTFTPDEPFSAGETVTVTLSNALLALDASPLRSSGFAWQFQVGAIPSLRRFREIDTFSNRTPGAGTTRIYGANASDFDDDGFLDLATVNEDSADIRVFLNRGDGSGTFEDFLDPVSIGPHASPNESADFDSDGITDLAVASVDGNGVWILLGNGDGSFRTGQVIAVGTAPHGVGVLDADGDGDTDVVAANHVSNNLALALNDGSGAFGAASFFDGGVAGEYGLAVGDVDEDGLLDLVVAGRDGQHLRALFGNGDGSFSQAAAAHTTGGRTWVLTLADVNADRHLDASTANSFDDSGSILLGAGDGSFGAPTLVATGGVTVSTALGDMDGDGDMDWVLSIFGTKAWRLYTNDGSGAFSFDQEWTSPGNASCAVLYDADNDGDVDMAVTDEIADVVVLLDNLNAVPCSPAPQACRAPLAPGKARISARNAADPAKERLRFSWGAGPATAVAELGNPLGLDGWSLCLYDAGALVWGGALPAGGVCGVDAPCWKATGKGFQYKDKQRAPDGMEAASLKGDPADGKPKAAARGKGAGLGLADFSALSGPLAAQLQRADGGLCLGASFSAPFQKQDGTRFKARSD
jgi:hypothetical protein